MQLAKYKVRRSRINHIFISHMHGDHYFGLVGLITSMGLLGRETPLHIYGPQPLQPIVEIQLNAAGNTLPYELHFHVNTSESVILDDEKFFVTCFKVQHRIECWGYAFHEKRAPRKIDKEKVIAAGIPATFYKRLQWGEDYLQKNGIVIKNEEVTIANTPGRSYAFCGDTIFKPEIAEKVKGVSLLYHEATYLSDSEERAASRFHCTARQAATIAKAADAKKLLIGHFSSKYETIDEFLTEAKAVFENTALAIEGVTFLIPKGS